MSSMIQLADISKTYTPSKMQAVTALKNVSFSIEKGEMVVVCGVSGSGKSTLLHIIGCLDTPSEGEIYLDGQSLKGLRDFELARIRNKVIGFVLQDFGLIPYRTAYENVSVPLIFSKTRPSDMSKKVNKALESVGIIELSKRKVSQMSGGQKQRVAIARALVNDPQIILADEPTGSLDSKTKLEIMEIFQGIHNAGKTIMIVTHDLEIAEMADRKLHMLDGYVSME